jgi:hypothetical protein
MEKNDLLTINLNVFELQESLRLTIPRDKEELYRNAAVQMNAAIKKYRQVYQIMPLEQLIAMTLLSVAVQSQTLANNKDISPLLSELEDLDLDLQKYLDSQVSK